MVSIRPMASMISATMVRYEEGGRRDERSGDGDGGYRRSGLEVQPHDFRWVSRAFWPPGLRWGIRARFAAIGWEWVPTGCHRSVTGTEGSHRPLAGGLLCQWLPLGRWRRQRTHPDRRHGLGRRRTTHLRHRRVRRALPPPRMGALHLQQRRQRHRRGDEKLGRLLQRRRGPVPSAAQGRRARPAARRHRVEHRQRELGGTRDRLQARRAVGAAGPRSGQGDEAG